MTAGQPNWPDAHLRIFRWMNFFSSVFGVCLFVCISTINKLLKGEKKFKSAGQILNRGFLLNTEHKNRFSVAAMNWLLDILAFCVAAVIFFSSCMFLSVFVWFSFRNFFNFNIKKISKRVFGTIYFLFAISIFVLRCAYLFGVCRCCTNISSTWSNRCNLIISKTKECKLIMQTLTEIVPILLNIDHNTVFDGFKNCIEYYFRKTCENRFI